MPPITRRKAIPVLAGICAAVVGGLAYLTSDDVGVEPTPSPTPTPTPEPTPTPTPTPTPLDVLIVETDELYELSSGDSEEYQHTAIRRGGRLTQDCDTTLSTTGPPQT